MASAGRRCFQVLTNMMTITFHGFCHVTRQVRELEMTRDSLAEELVAASQQSERAADVVAAMEGLRADMEELRTR